MTISFRYPVGGFNEVLSSLFPGGSTFTLNIGDLCYWDPTNGPSPAGQLSDQGSNYKNQRHFARNFIGVCNDNVLSTQAAGVAGSLSSQSNPKIIPHAVVQATATSAAYTAGQMLAIEHNAGNNGLLVQQLVGTNDPDLAIGTCLFDYPSGTTLIEARLMSRLGGWSPDGGRKSLFGGAVASTPAADVALSADDARIQIIANSAAINLKMPANAGAFPSGTAPGCDPFVIFNTSGGANSITVKDSAGTTTICTIAQNKSAILIYDSATPQWRAIVSS